MTAGKPLDRASSRPRGRGEAPRVAPPAPQAGAGGAAVRSYGSQGTHPSLLSRVRDPADHVAWREFESRYRDLLLRFCRGRGLQHADAEDVVQVVLANMSRSLPRFVYDRRRGRFRDYLYRCTRNVLSRWQARPKSAKGALVISVEDLDAVDSGKPEAGELGAQWEQEWVAYHYRLAMATIRDTFEARSVEIFDKNVAGAGVAALAEDYGMSQQAVHKVRQRIKARMEELIAEQVREEDGPDV